MTDQTIADEPTVLDVRRALMAEAADFHKRRQPHRHAMKIDNYNDIASDAYEGLATAGCYAQLISAILRDLTAQGQDSLVAEYAAFVHDVMENGDDGLEGANDDIPWGEDAAVLALVQAHAAADNDNRTPLADVLAEHGLTEADMEVEG